MTEVRSQIAQLVEDDEVHAGQMLGEPAFPTSAGLGLEPVDEVDEVVEASSCHRGCNFSRWRWPDGSYRSRSPDQIWTAWSILRTLGKR
jgi:hypothetical protein